MRIKAEDTMALVVDYQQSLMKVMHQSEQLERQAATLIRGLQVLGIPMVITQQYTKGLGMSPDSIFEAAGTRDYMEKNSFSCLKEESIVEKLRSMGKKNVIVCGIEAHICVLQTCIDLKEAGYQPVLITDCISSRTAENKAVGIARAKQEGVLVSSCESILFELLERSGTDTFKAISKLIK